MFNSASNTQYSMHGFQEIKLQSVSNDKIKYHWKDKTIAGARFKYEKC